MTSADEDHRADQTASGQRTGSPAEAGLDAAAAAWLAAVAAALETPEEHVVLPVDDLGGHELALLDFDPAAAERLRRIGRLIEVADAPGVRTALAISGSIAQARVHPYPADADFFERVHLQAADRATAARQLAALVRGNARETADEPALRLIEVHFGRQPGKHGSLRWSPAEVRAGVAVREMDGVPTAVAWDEAAGDPAFVKLDWFLVDSALGGPSKVSKVVDGTWEGPDGSIESLDGLIDPDFQQVYLAADDALAAARLVARAAPDLGRAAYLRAMEREIAKHLRQTPPDYVKIAKRLYNRCRLTGHYAEALWLRDLFDDPPARLVQLRARLEVIAGRCDDDPLDAGAALRVLILGDDDAATLAVSAGALLEPTNTWAPESLRDAVARLDAALALVIAERFGGRLRASPTISALLAEIDAASRG